MPQGKVVTFLRSLPGQASTLYWLPGQLMANSQMYRPEEPLHKKFEYIFRRKAIWEMMALSATICGIEFMYAAETAFVSPLLRILGTPTYFTSMVWGCSPILGVFITPLFGTLSDACNSRFGRRRPFIIALSIIVLVGLCLMGTSVSVAQKKEAKFMHKYGNATAFTHSRKLFIPNMEYVEDDDDDDDDDDDNGIGFEVTRRRAFTRRSSNVLFPPFHRNIHGNETTPIPKTTNHRKEDDDEEELKEMAEEEDFLILTSTTTTTTTRRPPRRRTTTEEAWVNNMREAAGYYEATTETPITAAAVHPLPIGMAILGVILMDFGCDASQSPCRTYLLDVCLPEDHRLGLRTFTISAGVGGTIGYFLAGMDMGISSADSAAGFFHHLKVVYTIIGILFVLFVSSTIFVFKEPTLEEWRDLQTIANETQAAAKREQMQKNSKNSSYQKLSRQASRKIQSNLATKAQPKQPERLPLMATRSCSDAMQQFKVQSDAAELKREESLSHDYQQIGGDYEGQCQRISSMDRSTLDALNQPKVYLNVIFLLNSTKILKIL